MTKSTIPIGIAILAFCVSSLDAKPPTGWFMAGSKPADYDASTDPQAAYMGRPSVHIKSLKPATGGFGTMMQCFKGEEYLGKRIRFNAYVKSVGIDGSESWAGLWVRVDKGTKSVAFDNMQNRSVKGTSDWRNYEVVLDVPADATGVCFGILLSESGSVWINGAKFEVVNPNTPVTDLNAAGATLPEAPRNLGFEK